MCAALQSPSGVDLAQQGLPSPIHGTILPCRFWIHQCRIRVLGCGLLLVTISLANLPEQ